MARTRKKDKHLPPNVYHRHGAYYFADKKGKWTRLSDNLAEAMMKWTKLIEPTGDIVCMHQLFDRYMTEVAPLKAAATYKTNTLEIQTLRKVFGEMSPHDIKAVSIYKFLDARGKVAPTRANREKALLSHVFSMAIRWGVVENNPCRNVKRIPVIRRDRYISDDEFSAVKMIATSEIQLMMEFTYLTGLRQIDVLKLKVNDLSDEGIFVHVSKTKDKLLIEWSDSLLSVVEKIKKQYRRYGTTTLFTNTKGMPYTSSGLQSVWQRLIKKAIKKNLISESFTFHDIRRKAATDLERKLGREMARQLLGHTDQKTTAIYISGVKKVKPVA